MYKRFFAILSTLSLYIVTHKTTRYVAYWGIRVSLVIVLLTMLVPSQPRAIITPIPYSPPPQPHVCVHTRLIDEVFEWKIQQSLQMTREMGATKIVEFFPWVYFEGRGKGQFDWQRADMIMRHAENQHLQVIARMGFVPEWARQTDDDIPTTFNTLPADSYIDFAEFVLAFGQRYENTISELIIWNEPNLALEWGFNIPDPVAYTELVQVTYPLVKDALPDIPIAVGALAPTLEPEGSPNGLNDLIFLEAMYDAGLQGYFDKLAVHNYGFTQPADQEPAPDALNFRRVELLRDIMLENGDADKPIIITEFGWNDHLRWANAVRPAQRAQYTIDAYVMAESWDWLEHLCVWVLRYPVDTQSYPDNFTLITTDFIRKPIYYAIQSYAFDTERGQELWLEPPVASDS